MFWFLVARGLLFVAITWAAIVTEPVPGVAAANAALGVGVSGLVILPERRLRGVSALGLLGGLIAAGIGLAIAMALNALFRWVNHGNPRVAFLHGAIPAVLVYLGVVIDGCRRPIG